ncbi:extracellular solute-binding protein [Actinophytocola sp.]|uniref:extracellular solute-binding protein n=1 Tax=Actinophytocola sp. TaxID=1872138 RepID=UPI003D6BDE54
MQEAIDSSRPLPVYVQLKTLLMEQIVSGRYAPGARLPTEHELCRTYGISRTPVNRALSELAEEGVVLRHRRRGSFVNPHWIAGKRSAAEVRVVVPDGRWEEQIRQVTPDGLVLNIATVDLADLHSFLIHAVAEGRAPDLAVIDSVWTREFAASGFLAPLDELDPDWIRREYETDFLEPFRSANQYRERTVAVQAEADVAGLWYRRDDLAGTDRAEPRTWDDLAAVLRTLRRDGDHPPLTLPGGSRGGETTTYCLLALLAANGARVVESGRITLHTPRTVECLAFLRGLVVEGLVSADVVSYEWDRPIRQLAQGQASLAFGGSYDAVALAEAASLPRERLLDVFGFTSVPTGPHRVDTTLSGGMAYAIFRQARQSGQAMRLLRDVVSTEAQIGMSTATWQLASRKSAVTRASEGSPFLCTTGRMLAGATVRPATTQYARVSVQLQAMLEAVLVGRLEPASACERAAEMINAITGLPIAY